MSANDAIVSQDWRTTSTTTYRPSGRRIVRRELRGQVTRAQVMGYRVKVDHLTYLGTRDGQPFTLASALDAIRGCGNAHVLRPTGEVVR